MNGMTTQDRLDDICKISGLSEDIVRRVFDAERISISKSLKKGERANLIGRCVIRPEIRGRIESCETNGRADVREIRHIKLSATVAASMEAMLKDMGDFEVDSEDTREDLPEGILVSQIQALV